MLHSGKFQSSFCILSLLFITAFCSSCGNEKPTGKLDADSFVAANERIPVMDIKYGTEEGQSMDIYYPLNGDRVAQKVMIMVHGGGFVAGDKSDFTEVIKVLRVSFRDVMFVNVNYRLATPQSPALPKQLDDLGAVLQYLKTDPDFKPKKLIFNGGSAGAYLSLMYALNRDKDHDVTAVIASSCIFDFNDPEFKRRVVAPMMFESLFGSDSLKWTSELLAKHSIINHLSPTMPETLLIIGEDDELFPSDQVRRMDLLLDSMNVSHEALIYKGEHHGFSERRNLDHLVIMLNGFIANHFLAADQGR